MADASDIINSANSADITYNFESKHKSRLYSRNKAIQVPLNSQQAKNSRFQVTAARKFLSQIAESQRNKNVRNPASCLPKNMTVAEALSFVHVMEFENDVKTTTPTQAASFQSTANSSGEECFDFTKNNSSEKQIISQENNPNCFSNEERLSITLCDNHVWTNNEEVHVSPKMLTATIDNVANQHNMSPVSSEYLENPFLFIPTPRSTIKNSKNTDERSNCSSNSSSVYYASFDETCSRLPMSTYLSPLFLFAHQIPPVTKQSGDNADLQPSSTFHSLHPASEENSKTSNIIYDTEPSTVTQNINSGNLLFNIDDQSSKESVSSNISLQSQSNSKNTTEEKRKRSEKSPQVYNEEYVAKKRKYEIPKNCNIDPRKIMHIVRTDLLEKKKYRYKKCEQESLPFPLYSRASRIHSKPIMSGNEILENLKKEEKAPLKLPIKQQPTVRQVIFKQIQSVSPEIAQMLAQRNPQKIDRAREVPKYVKESRKYPRESVHGSSIGEELDSFTNDELNMEPLPKQYAKISPNVRGDTKRIDENTNLGDGVDILNPGVVNSNEEIQEGKRLDIDSRVKSIIDEFHRETATLGENGSVADAIVSLEESKEKGTETGEVVLIDMGNEKNNENFSLPHSLARKFDTHIIKLIT